MTSDQSVISLRPGGNGGGPRTGRFFPASFAAAASGDFLRPKASKFCRASHYIGPLSCSSNGGHKSSTATMEVLPLHRSPLPAGGGLLFLRPVLGALPSSAPGNEKQQQRHGQDKERGPAPLGCGDFRSHAGRRRYRRGSVAVRCSSVADERQALFGRIAPVYDHLNDVLSLGQHRTWKRICVSWSMPKRGDRVLDLCCGSGDLAFLLSQNVGLDGEVMAVDFSKQQLQTAASRRDQRWKPCYKNIKWIEGDALDLPFTDCCFDAITVGYGLRNVVDKAKAMREIFRVLKPGSRASILDFNKSSSFFTTSLQNWAIDNVVVPLASGYGLTEEYKYLKSSISQYLTGEELEKLAKEAGFSSAKHYELGGGLMGDLVATR